MIVITGKKHVGKTTVLKKVLSGLKKDVYGIISESIEDGYRVEDLKTGEKRILASKKKIGFKLKGYYFDPKALTFIEKALSRKGDILIYDEIGHLETRGIIDISPHLRDNAIVIVRKDKLDKFLRKVENYKVFTVTERNRNKISEAILVSCNEFI
ncbi:MAG: nucleoside-triphosphatase [Euryarchaeota archaeon]|nr:nucleoside-triphosphatase [Euryarchaeota archaeon]